MTMITLPNGWIYQSIREPLSSFTTYYWTLWVDSDWCGQVADDSRPGELTHYLVTILGPDDFRHDCSQIVWLDFNKACEMALIFALDCRDKWQKGVLW